MFRSGMHRFLLLLAFSVVISSPAQAEDATPALDLTRAVILLPDGSSAREKLTAALLQESARTKSRLQWKIQTGALGEGNGPVIALGTRALLQKQSPDAPQGPAGAAEGFEIRVGAHAGRPTVWVAGNDSRGVLFGMGRLLRAFEMSRDRVMLPAGFAVKEAPKMPIRGHQLGYRPKTNSYDAWDLRQWRRYFADLAVFGCNAVELIPPRSDDDADSPHFPLPPMDMMIAMSKALDDLDMDVWIWYPAMDRDYTNPATVEAALKEWGQVFQKLPRIDAIFVPGGDPGHTKPDVLFALLEKQTAILNRYHPKAKMWMSPQGFDKEWMDEFFELMKKEPTWLAGIVCGPQVRYPISEMRKLLPSRYPIRLYPDITHCWRCQYPVPSWDVAFAATLGREPINPRPVDEAIIFHHTYKDSIGFITYSEGCNDDVNKAVWSALGWDPDADVHEVLHQFSRYFIGPEYTDTFSQGLFNLERNWRGPALTNYAIDTTLEQFQTLERKAGPATRANWRFQQALYRAYYDAFVRRRLLYETDLEAQAYDKLKQARRGGSLAALDDAQAVLDRAVTAPVARDLRARVFELAEALFQSVRMQLSVERYQAIDIGRGANLDLIDIPLNDRVWLERQFDAIRQLKDETDRRKQIDALVHWTDPGPGGFYDDLGNETRQPHLVPGLPYAKDPANFASIQMLQGGSLQHRKSWWTQGMALYDAPLTMRYPHLDSGARYKVRVVYGDGPIRLTANENTPIHDLLRKPFQVLEYDVPQEATARGSLTLTWHRAPGFGGAGRGNQVAEVWLIRNAPASSAEVKRRRGP